MIQQIIAAAKLAPTGNNAQPFEIMVVNDSAVIDEIENIIGEEFRPPFAQKFGSPAMLLPLADPRFCKTFPQGDGVPERILLDSMTLAIDHMYLAIAALGLGSLWKDIPPAASTRIKELLKIPQGFMMPVSMPLGFLDDNDIEPRPKRDIPVHFGIYDQSKYLSDAEIDQIIEDYIRVKILGNVTAL
jgi:nitroreductase